MSGVEIEGRPKTVRPNTCQDEKEEEEGIVLRSLLKSTLKHYHYVNISTVFVPHQSLLILCSKTILKENRFNVTDNNRRRIKGRRENRDSTVTILNH
jgi:hypothetical protein